MRHVIVINFVLLALVLLVVPFRGTSAVTKVAVIGTENQITLSPEIVTSYIELLEQSLGEDYDIANFCSKDAFVTGKNSILKSEGIKDALKYKPDVVVIDVGFNDASPENWCNAKQFYKAYAKIVAKFKAKNHDVRILLCKPTPVFDNALAKQAENITEKVIPIIETIGKIEQLQVVDLYSALLWNPQAFTEKTTLNHKGLSIVTRVVSRTIKQGEATSSRKYQTAFKF